MSAFVVDSAKASTFAWPATRHSTIERRVDGIICTTPTTRYLMLLMRLCGMLAVALFALAGSPPAQAFLNPSATRAVIAPLVKSAKVLPAEEIVRLAKVAEKTNGTKEIGQILGKLNLSDEILEDTYMRIAVYQAKLPSDEAARMFARLSGTDGFRTTLRKIIGNSEAMTTGHLHELRRADEAVQHNFKVKGIGIRFNDGVKRAETDMDVVLQKNGRTIAIEAKNYLPTTPIPMDQFRADMISLTQYQKLNPSGRVVPVFSITNRPIDLRTVQLLEKEAERHGVDLIYGSPSEQILQIEHLVRIL